MPMDRTAAAIHATTFMSSPVRGLLGSGTGSGTGSSCPASDTVKSAPRSLL